MSEDQHHKFRTTKGGLFYEQVMYLKSGVLVSLYQFSRKKDQNLIQTTTVGLHYLVVLASYLVLLLTPDLLSSLRTEKSLGRSKLLLGRVIAHLTMPLY